MIRTKLLKNIGTVVANEIKLTDTTLGLYIPIETESKIVKAEREKFESWVTRDFKKHFPTMELNTCTLHTETDLYINTGFCDEHGKYELTFSVGFISWFTDKESNEVYYEDISDGFEIELPEDDKSYIKEIVAAKIVDILI